METIEKYQVELKNMREDSCQYEYILDDHFFTIIDAPDIHKGNLRANLKVKKGIATYTLDFHIEGVVTVPCDRCLDDMEIDIETEDSLKVKLGTEFSDEDELITVPEEDGFINVAWFMYEFIALSLPLKHTHAPGECNEEMVESLNQHLRYTSDDEDLDEESHIDGDEEESENVESHDIDPRWEALKKILNNN